MLLFTINEKLSLYKVMYQLVDLCLVEMQIIFAPKKR